MPFESFATFYQSDAQSVILLQAMPLAFLAWRAAYATPHRRAVDPAASAFVALWTLGFAFETLLDPWATGPFVKALGLGDGLGGSVVMFVFVWLGDFRVLGLMLGTAALSTTGRGGLGRALGRAAGLTCVVPVASGVLNLGLGAAFDDLPGQTLWVIYELGFLALAIWLGRRWVAHSGVDGETGAYLRALAGYSAAYYALWASADMVILVLGMDAGWALRVVPNQLYYGGWVIFAYARFYRSTPLPSPNASHQAASSTSTQAER